MDFPFLRSDNQTDHSLLASVAHSQTIVTVLVALVVIQFSVICYLVSLDPKQLVLGRWGTTSPRPKAKRAPATGKITLVGAGPGDPGLLTRAAYEAIQNADVVITDRLISPEILRCVPPSVEIKVSKKFKGRAQAAQEELHQWMVQGARQGKHVVRLKGGDPFLYGRGGEEVRVVVDHGFPIKVIPGISSVFGAPLAAGIPVTSRNVADRLVILSGHCKKPDAHNDATRNVDSVCCTSQKQSHTLNAGKLKIPAYDQGTSLVFLMSVGTLANVQQQLVEDSKTPLDCPVAFVERATTATQRVTVTTVKDMVSTAMEREVASPATIIVGHVATCLAHGPELKGNVSTEFVQGGVVFTPTRG